ncbi:uncharacterized protein RB166_019400 isoform 2-T2 [Leptodactylus fuscus]
MERSIIVCLLIWVIGVHCDIVTDSVIVTSTGDGKCKVETTPSTSGTTTMTITAPASNAFPSPGAATITLPATMTSLVGQCETRIELPPGFRLECGYRAITDLVVKFNPEDISIRYPCPSWVG